MCFNTTATGDDRRAGDKSQKKGVNVNVKDVKPDRNVTFRDDYDDEKLM